ncbi:hypothetical protein AG1IA_03898 [Rhizoctonia solani AG-1 IA]|uniref:Uncharacterized protein n=1 Tax=Thanatephorus cucumeris (strain AG1-IA) TaxID=983506 RepID=L8WVQ3_THACA|nr:hypothetical protein AG1IA_03898 [Rhizoctonia solani AG-1 IA]
MFVVTRSETVAPPAVNQVYDGGSRGNIPHRDGGLVHRRGFPRSNNWGQGQSRTVQQLSDNAHMHPARTYRPYIRRKGSMVTQGPQIVMPHERDSVTGLYVPI